MSVFLLALNEERGILFTWKCLSTAEARGIMRRIHRSFSHCLNPIAIHHSRSDKVLIPKSKYTKQVHFTFESHPYYYIQQESRLFIGN